MEKRKERRTINKIRNHHSNRNLHVHYPLLMLRHRTHHNLKKTCNPPSYLFRHSETYTGATTEIAPIPIPEITRPVYISDNPLSPAWATVVKICPPSDRGDSESDAYGASQQNNYKNQQRIPPPNFRRDRRTTQRSKECSRLQDRNYIRRHCV